ncbi:MAG: hypothetical protein KAI29_09065 [Cyclobacteriaceae bacterium]|nr:hypothetical protein [Cyclobacteriaceae bacterium]
MKTAIFNFLVLQVVVWTLVFSSSINEKTSEVNYATISDTWEVVNIGENINQDVVMHYPTFNKLTLNLDGSYIRLRVDETLESGKWSLDASKSQLTLTNESETQKFEQIQLPNSNSKSFIIKESVKGLNAKYDIKYELTRS